MVIVIIAIIMPDMKYQQNTTGYTNQAIAKYYNRKKFQLANGTVSTESIRPPKIVTLFYIVLC